MTSGNYKNESHKTYLQCPYCSCNSLGGRVPKTVGRYKVKKIHNILIFQCRKCARVFKIEVIPKLFLWERMNNKKREEFKKVYYKNKKEVYI